MSDSNTSDSDVISARLGRRASRDAIRVTVHAHQEMAEEGITYDEVREVLASARVLENYPDHRRGACCLVCCRTSKERFVHVVCTTSLEVAIIITVYEPKPPKWASPFERGKQE